MSTRGRDWHVAHWPPLAWLETVIKLAALVIGIASLAGVAGDFQLVMPTGYRLAQWITMLVLALGLAVAIIDRIVERELVALGFVIVNNLGHWGMVLALVSVAGPGRGLVPFAGLMLLGDLVKLLFLRVHQFQVRDTSPTVLYGLTLFYVAGYVAILVFEYLR